MSSIKNTLFSAVTVSVLLSSFSAVADPFSEQQNPAGNTQKMGINELRAAAQNPLTPMFSLPLRYVYHGDANRGGVSVGTIQPIFPLALNQDWRLINQLSLNFIDTPGGVTGIAELPNPYVKYPALGPKGAAGLADLNFTSLLSPVAQNGISWGIGGTVTMPSDAPSRELGSGKFSLGPAGAVIVQNDKWTAGLQVNQIWSVFGSVGRATVAQMLLKPILNYNLDDGWYLTSHPVIVANWHIRPNQRWTVPIGGGFGKMFSLGDYKINSRIEGYYNIDRPDQAPDWSIATTVQLLFPE